MQHRTLSISKMENTQYTHVHMYLLVCSCHRKEYSIMILKENLIEWKVSCLCLFTECLPQSPGSHICCDKEWEAKCQCEWPLVRGPGRERCDVYEVSANNTSQCKQEAGKKHSDLATRTLNNGHLMGTPQNDKHAAVLPTYLCRVFSLLSVCILFSLSGYVDRERASSRILFWATFSRIPSKLLHAVRNALAIWVSIFDNYYVHKHCHSKE